MVGGGVGESLLTNPPRRQPSGAARSRSDVLDEPVHDAPSQDVGFDRGPTSFV